MGCCGKGKPIEPIPPLKTRVANLGTALVHWALSGFKLAPDDVYQQRIDICHNNECGQLVDDAICKHPKCGCPVTRKAALYTESCPLGLWKSLQEPKPEKVIQYPKIKPDCSHGSYVGHVAFNRKQGETHSIEVTAKCKLCGSKLMFKLSESEYGIVDTLKANIVILEDAGT